jgi:hypothetical protein
MSKFNFDYQSYLKTFSWRTQEEVSNKDYIKSAPAYTTPNNSRINYKLGNYDLETKANRDFIKESSRFFYHKMMEEDEWVNEKYTDVELIEDETEKANVIKKKAIYDSIDTTTIPGFTPLDQAIFLFYSLLEEDQQVNGGANSGNVCNMATSQMVQKIGAINMTDSMLYDPILEEFENTPQPPNAPKPFKGNYLKTLNKLALIENLGSEFKVEKEVEEKISIIGDIPAVRKMNSYSQVVDADLYQFGMPDFNLKFAQKDLMCNLKVEKTDHKQKIICMIDSSSSMTEGLKHEWLATILLDRLRYAAKEEAELFILTYRGTVEKSWHVFDKKSAMSFWRTYDYYTASCTTEVGKCINYVDEQVKSGDFMGMGVDLSQENPEILVIGDGNDGIDKSFEYKTNTITLMDRINKDLKKLCLKTGGKYIHLDDEGMQEFTKNGTKIRKFKRTK